MGQGKGGGAPKGNKNNEKFKTPEQRQKAYTAFCDHIAQGFTQKAFHDPCTMATIDKMLATYPAEFDPEPLEIAKAKSTHFWEKMGIDGAKGLISGFNSGTWIFNMKNREGWKDAIEHGFDKDRPAVFVLKMGKKLSEKGELHVE